jgi:fibronectin-binding autotransporter adhesin
MHPRPAFVSHRRPLILVQTIAALMCAGTVHAANKTWSGSGADNNWLTGANWDFSTAPAINDALFFAGNLRLAPVNNFPVDTRFNGITFSVGAGSFNLSGAGIILSPGLAAGGGTVTGGSIVNGSANAQTIGLPITLAPGNHQITTTANGGPLNLSGSFSRQTGATAIFNRLGGNINLSGSGLANDATGILGGWAVTNIGTNTGDWAALDASGNVVPYAGYTPVAPAEVIASGAQQNIKISTNGGNITMNAGITDVNTLLYNGGAGNQTVAIGTGNALRLGAKGAMMITTGSAPSSNRQFIIGAGAGQGSLTAGGADNQAGEIFLYNNSFGGTNNDLTINASIVDNGSSAFPVTVHITGYIAMANTANSYSGGTFINQGRVQAGSASSFGTGPVSVFPGAQAFLNNAGTFANDFFVSGIGTTEANGGITAPGAIRLGSTSNVAGRVTLQGDTRISTNGTGGPQISGQITGAGNLELITFATNNSVLVLSNTNAATPNNWTGNLQISSLAASRSVTVRLGANEQVPDQSNVTISGIDLARFDLNGFAETIGGLNGSVSTNNIVTNSGANPSTLTVGSNDAPGNFGGVIQDGIGALSLVKIGAGSQTLGGTNVYTGTTTINSGTLSITGSLAGGAVTVNAGGTLTGSGFVGGPVTIQNGGGLAGGAAGIGTLNLAAGATLGVIAGDTSTITVGQGVGGGTVNVTGGLNVMSGNQSVTIHVIGIAPAIGQYVLVDYDTLGGTGFAAFKLGNVAGRVAASLVNNLTTGSLDLNVTGAGDSVVWTGSFSSEWSTAILGAPKNWGLASSSATVTDYIESDSVIFNDDATNPLVTLNTNVAPGSVLLVNAAQNYTLTGTGGIAGGTTLTKDGIGTATIATNNSYAGGTVIAGGTLQVGNGGISGTLGAGNISNQGILSFNRSDNFTATNVIDGVGDLVKVGAGILTLAGANPYAGPTVITAGTLRVTNAAGGNSSLGSLTGGMVVVASGAALDLSGSPTAQALNFGGKQFRIAGAGPDGSGAIVNFGVSQFNALQQVALTGNATVGGSQRFDIRSDPTGALNADLDLAGHTLTKSGANQFSLVGVDVTDGDIIVDQGIFAIETVTAIPDFGTGRKITMNAGTTLQLFNATASPSAIQRPFVFNGQGSQIGVANNATSILGSPIQLNGDLTVTALNNAPATSALRLDGAITETGIRSMTKNGVNILVLAGNNSYSGGTTINGGTVQMQSATALGAPGAPLTVNTGGTLDLFANNLTVGNFSGTNGTITNTGFTAAAVTVDGSGDTTFDGTIQDGSGVVSLVKQGSGALILAGLNTYLGGTAVNAGTLAVNGSISGQTIVNGGILRGTGTVGALTLTSGILAPGGSPGILNVGNLALDGGSFAIELGGPTPGNGAGFHDQVNVVGTVSFGAPVALTLDFAAYDPIDNVDSFVLINNDDVDLISLGGPGVRLVFGGNPLDEAAQFTAVSGAFTQMFSITYAGGTSGNDVVLNAVPEPGAGLALLGGLGVLAGARRRRSCVAV